MAYPFRVGFGEVQLAVEQLNGVQLRLSAVEVYNEQVYDLIASKSKLEIKNGQLREVAAPNGFFGEYSKHRSCGRSHSLATRSTACNQRSSRSHCFVFIDVPSVAGRLIFVDMAGSENFEQAGISGGDAKLQSAKINQGNAAMKRVVEATANGDAYVPYRDSKLTMLLQDSFKEEKILMILCLSPAASDVHRTVCTLEYGAKAKSSVRQVPGVAVKSEAARGWNHLLHEACSKRDAEISELRELLQQSKEQLQEDDLRAERLRTVQAENLKVKQFAIEQQKLLTLIAEERLRSFTEKKSLLQCLAGKIFQEPVPQHQNQEAETDEELAGLEQHSVAISPGAGSGRDVNFVDVAQREQDLAASSPEASGVRGCIKRGLGPPPRPVSPLTTSNSNRTSRECEVIVQWETVPGALVCTVRIDEHAFLQELRELITPRLAGLKKRFQFMMLGDGCLITDTSLESEVRVVSLPRACNGESRLAVLRPPITRSFRRREPRLLPVEERQEEKSKEKPATSKRSFSGKRSRKISLQEHATMACINSLLAATR